MIRDLVKEEAVARAVRWAEMLPADATAEESETLAREVERLEDEVEELEQEVWDLS